jgi:hypothetical protein
LPILRTYLPSGAQAVVLHDSDGDLNHAMAAQMQGKRVWAVFGHAGQSAASKQDWPEFYAKIAKLGTPRQIQVAGNRIYITMFDPMSHGVSTNCTMSSPTSVPPPAPNGACG